MIIKAKIDPGSQRFIQNNLHEKNYIVAYVLNSDDNYTTTATIISWEFTTGKIDKESFFFKGVRVRKAQFSKSITAKDISSETKFVIYTNNKSDVADIRKITKLYCAIL
ncbi:MAG: hypothetical protein JXA94_06740 [Parachlamydiales bacterium]|nr:hypothetical protein [Parachlamydiales bacterium]